MKTIKLSKGKESVFVPQVGREVDLEFNTSDLIKTCINQPPQGGFTAEDIFNVIQIQSAIKALPEDVDVLELEDSYYKFIKDRVNQYNPMIAAQSWLDFKELFK